MKRFSEQLKKQSDSIRLRAAERRELQERLVSYMEYHPLPADMVTTKKAEAVDTSLTTEAYRTISLSSFYIKGVFGALTLVLLVGVPLVAERALPGDVLYPVKVKFNEEVMSTLTLSPYEKVEWETERLGRRIAEARLLASEGKLTEEFEADVAEAVKSHSDAAKREIENIRATDAEEAAIAEITFSSALEVQSAVLRSEEEEAGTSTDAIVGAVEEERSQAAQNQTASEAVPSIERLLARIEQETTRAYELLATVREYASVQEITDIERRLADIERKIGAAIALREEEGVVEADVRVLLRESLQATQKLIVFMTDIDVRETVVIEDLVPVELTDEERVAAISAQLAEIAELLPLIEVAVTESGADPVGEKASTIFTDMNTSVSEASLALSEERLDDAEVAATEAYTLFTDIVALLDITAPVEEETEPEDVEEDVATTTPAVEEEEEVATTTDPVEEDTEPEVVEEEVATSSPDTAEATL